MTFLVIFEKKDEDYVLKFLLIWLNINGVKLQKKKKKERERERERKKFSVKGHIMLKTIQLSNHCINVKPIIVL
jgi:hypothetical protein